MPVQDDVRENEMIQRFNLTVPDDRKRSDIDAHLAMGTSKINFELKSTTSGSVSTVRDFGPDHIVKWRAKLHWLFAFYNEDGTRLRYCIYASPDDMESWITAKELYIRPDLELAESLPRAVDADMVIASFGAKNVYSIGEAKLVMKKQWRAKQYKEFQDLPEGYSLERMTQIMQLRARYLILRGSTLNNPHIEAAFFDRFEKITDNHAARLRELVASYLKTARTDLATA